MFNRPMFEEKPPHDPRLKRGDVGDLCFVLAILVTLGIGAGAAFWFTAQDAAAHHSAARAPKGN